MAIIMQSLDNKKRSCAFFILNFIFSLYSMKKIFTLALGLGFAAQVQAQMTFEKGTWADVKAKAKQENKMIFVDAYTTWCGPCKMMSKSVFPDTLVGKHYNTNFINFKMDMEQGEGVQFAQDYKVQAYPTLLYFTKEGELAHRTVGAPDAATFVENGKNALLPEKQFYTLLKKYEKGNREKKFLHQIAAAAADADAENKIEIAEAFMKTIKQSDWLADDNIKIVASTVSTFSSPVFKHLEANFDKLPQDLMAQTTYQCLEAEIKKAVEAKDENMMKAMQDKVTKYMPEQYSTQINPRIEKIFYEKTGLTKK